MFHLKRSLFAALTVCGLAAFFGCFESSCAAQAVAEKAAAMKQSDSSLNRVTNDIEYLASDELGGRKPGTPEMKLSEDYIVKAYRDAGLVDPTGTGTYFQTFEVGNEKRVANGSASLTLTLTGPKGKDCLLYTSPSPRDRTRSRMPSSA